MWQRIIPILLCLALLLSNIAPVVSATDNTSEYSDEVVISDGTVINSGDDVQEDAEDSVIDDMEDDAEKEDPMPECDCGNSNAPMVSHSDGCALKSYWNEMCALSATELYVLLRTVPDDVREHMLQHLEWNYSATLKELQDLWAAVVEGEADFTGTASLTVEGGTTVDTMGIPVGSTMTVDQVSDAIQAVVDNAVMERDDLVDELFTWDISVADKNGDEWQPDGDSVTVKLEIPDVKVHKYAEVVVVHVDDNGEVSYIDAKVNEDGTISFATEGFSTFAGFTVEFEYGAALYSLGGLESVLLSELFEAMQMPLYVTDVADVTFTDDSLLALEKQNNGDWLLTSLKAFDTKEALTVTMKDGTVHQIDVTDPIKIDGGTASSGISYIYWFADEDGNLNLTNGSTNIGTKYESEYWSQEKDIIISGTAKFEIVLRVNPNMTKKILLVISAPRAILTLSKLR